MEGSLLLKVFHSATAHRRLMIVEMLVASKHREASRQAAATRGQHRSSDR